MPVITKGPAAAGGSHAHCIICGELNQLSLKLKFFPGEAGDVVAAFQGHGLLQGYDGILHGGIISALLDSAMAHCLFHRGIEAVTGQLFIRFLASVPCNARVTVRAWLVEEIPPLYQLRAELKEGDAVMARGEAKFMQRMGNNDVR